MVNVGALSSGDLYLELLQAWQERLPRIARRRTANDKAWQESLAKLRGAERCWLQVKGRVSDVQAAPLDVN